MSGKIHLKEFSKEQLLFDEQETRIILKFIFKAPDHKVIDTMIINDPIKGFAQGLLVEAVDASYSISFVQALFESTAKPNNGALTIIKSFGKKAAKNWFKHASAKDLQDIKIYDFVRDTLARSFRTRLRGYLAKNKGDVKAWALVTYTAPTQGVLIRWG